MKDIYNCIKQIRNSSEANYKKSKIMDEIKVNWPN